MEETVKKAKTPAKPRKAATKKATVAEVVAVSAPSRDEIARLARKYWEDRGWQDGYAEHDWLRAERELRGLAS